MLEPRRAPSKMPKPCARPSVSNGRRPAKFFICSSIPISVVIPENKLKPRVLDKLVVSSLFCGAVIFAQQQKSMPPATTERPLADRIATFERPDRVARLMPDEVVKALHLKDGDVVADVGAGTGVMTRRFAKAVAPAGKVYAVDIDGEI